MHRKAPHTLAKPSDWTDQDSVKFQSQIGEKHAIGVLHSYLSATIGSTRMARCAGTYAAATATRIRNTATPRNVTGSCVPTPKSRLVKRRATTNAPASPMATPTTVSLI